MSEDSVISDEMRNEVGVEYSYTCLVEKDMLRRVYEAVEDPNPLWQDGEYAKKGRYGGMIAFPSFFTSLGLGEAVLKYCNLECPLKAGVNGGYEVEYFQPIRPGEVITATIKLAGLEEKSGKKGKLILMFLEVVCTNQKGEVAVKLNNTLIRV